MTSHILFIDSRDRDFQVDPTPNRYKIMLPQTYYNVISARLLSAEIPRSFHTFSQKKCNTSFDISIGGATQTITIQDGNYTFDILKTALEIGLSSATGLSWTVFFSSTTNCATVFNSEGKDFTIHSPASEHPTDYGLLFYLGFQSGKDYPSETGKVTSDRPASFHGVSYILMDIEELRGAAESGMYGGQVGGSPFAKIAMDPGAQGVTMLDTSKCTMLSMPQRPVVPRLKELRVSFRYHDGSPVDFNNVDHSFTLCLETQEPAFMQLSQVAYDVRMILNTMTNLVPHMS